MLQLKANPTFKSKVKIPVPGGPEIAITVEFKHMTKAAYQAFIAKERALETARPDEEAIMDIASGWEGVDSPFNLENVRELCQQYHGAGAAIVEQFIEDLTQFRKGNS